MTVVIGNPILETRPILKTRLNAIIQQMAEFWEKQRLYIHFTNQGIAHSERVQTQKLAQLVQELPENKRLTEDEIFIVSAAAWLYEIGMQSPNTKSVLGFDFQPNKPLSFSEREKIRETKHVLTYNLLLDILQNKYHGLSLGPPDDYNRLIAEVCRGCSNEPLENIPETVPVANVPIRVRLLVALLRLADHLYIDSSRVNLNLLVQADLPVSTIAHWWAYHYTQTLPIGKGKIPFYYFLPISHKPYLDHIRALIEPNFEFDNNPTLQYLFDYGVRLVPNREPNVRYDQTGFQREMPKSLLDYLRYEVKPTQTDEPRPGLTDEYCLLVLDYENFILQMGREGHFFTEEEANDLVVTLLTKASVQYNMQCDSLVVGHWGRPDMQDIAKRFREQAFNLLTLDNDESASEKLSYELPQQLQLTNPPTQILLVAPPKELISFVRQVQGKKLVDIWISSVSASRIFRATAHFKILSELLDLTTNDGIVDSELINGTAACIFSLTEHIAKTNRNTISISEIPETLKYVEHTTEQETWWQLWLINQQILIPDEQNQFKLNPEHSEVINANNKRRVVIETLQSLAKDDQAVDQESLLNQLKSHSNFRQEKDEQIVDFLEILKDGEVLFRSYSTDDIPSWILNPAHSAVVKVNEESYLSLLILITDHALIKEGRLFLYEHNFQQVVKRHIGPALTETVFQLGQEAKVVEKRSESKRKFNNIYLDDRQGQVKQVILNNDILLGIVGRQELSRDALWCKVKGVRTFTIGQQGEFNQWLDVLEREEVITIKSKDGNRQNDLIRLNTASLLTQRLQGRVNLCGLVKMFCLNRATGPKGKKPSSEMVDRLKRYVTHNEELAGWTLDYAKTIRLVHVEKRKTKNGTTDFVHLNSGHRFVRQLNEQERQTHQPLIELVRGLPKHKREGWVSRHVVISEMERDNQTFGYGHAIHNYLLDQAIHRYKALEQKREKVKGHRIQEFIRVRENERHQTRPEDVWMPYLQQLEITTKEFWEDNQIHRYPRLQSHNVWKGLYPWLKPISNSTPLTPFETFLLQVSVHFYEIGWQVPNAPEISLADRYDASGRVIRESFLSRQQSENLGLSSLESETVDVLARICEAVGLSDISTLETKPTAAGYQETARLRYLVAILQLADMLSINRANDTYIRHITQFESTDIMDARLVLSSYIPLIQFEQYRLTVHYRLHPDDEPLAQKVVALFEEPIRQWQAKNLGWLSEEFGYFFGIDGPKIEIVHDGIPPEPFKKKCQALISFLEKFEIDNNAEADPNIYENFIGILQAMGQIDEARQVIQLGILEFPKRSSFYSFYGQIERLAKNYDQAEEVCRTGLQYDPYHLHLRIELAQILVHRGTDESVTEAGVIYKQLLSEGKISKKAPFYQRYRAFKRGPYVYTAFGFFQGCQMEPGIVSTRNLPDDITDLVIDIQSQEFAESFGLSDAILVRCYQGKPSWHDLAELQKYLSGLGLHNRIDVQDGRHFAINTALAFIVVKNSDVIRDQVMRIIGESQEAIVPLDNEELENLDNPLQALRDVLGQYLGRRDLYDSTAPVSGRRFFGREKLLRQVVDDIQKGKFIGIYGLRKIGKTSLLHELARERLPEEAVVIVDLQKISGTFQKNCDAVYWQLEKALYDKYRENETLCQFLHLGKYRRFSELPSDKLNQIGLLFAEDMEAILEAIQNDKITGIKRLILILDELEHILPVGHRRVDGYIEFFALLRGLAQSERYQGLLSSIVVAANAAISERGYWEGRENPVFALYKPIFLPPFTLEECSEMIVTLGKGMSVYWTDGALKIIFTETGGHPFLTRIFCSFITKQYPQRPLKSVTESMVQEQFLPFIREQSDKFEQIIELLHTNYSEEEKLLEQIALDEAPADIPDELLRHLLGYQLIRLTDERYQITINLLCRWLRRSSGIKD